MDKEEWVLRHFMPYLLWNWRPLPTVNNSPHMDDVHDDVSLEDIIWGLSSETVSALVQDVRARGDWSRTRANIPSLSQQSVTPSILKTLEEATMAADSAKSRSPIANSS